jgi:hypothetical protein
LKFLLLQYFWALRVSLHKDLHLFIL